MIWFFQLKEIPGYIFCPASLMHQIQVWRGFPNALLTQSALTMNVHLLVLHLAKDQTNGGIQTKELRRDRDVDIIRRTVYAATSAF
jgi:hypothetical protein